VGDVLVAALPELRDRLLEETLRTEWSRLIGAELGRRSRPGRLRGGVLEVTVDNSTWLHEMTLRSGELLAKLQPRFESVAALKLGLGAVPSSTAPSAHAARGERPSPLSREELRGIEDMVAFLPDPTLVGPLRRLLTKDLLARRGNRPRRGDDPRPVEREDS
jgi:hypothetical protein